MDRAWWQSTARRHCPGTRLPHALADALAAHDVDVELEDARRSFASWDEVERRTSATVLPGDPVFARIFDGAARRPGRRAAERPRARNGTTVVFGPGSALALARPALVRRRSQVAEPRAGPEGARRERRPAVGEMWVRSSGSSSSTGRCSTVTSRSSFPRIDRYLDVGDPAKPRARSRATLSASPSRSLADRPFRVRPTFFPGPWGGQWLRRRLGIRDGRVEPRVVLRADHARERTPARRRPSSRWASSC